MTVTLRGKLEAIIRRELAKVGILTKHEYRVVEQIGDAVQLQIVRKVDGLQDAPLIVSRSCAGYRPTYRPGDSVIVSFVAGDPARPFIAHGPEAGLGRPEKVVLDADDVEIGEHASSVNIGDPLATGALAKAVPVDSAFSQIMLTVNPIVTLLTGAMPGTPVLTITGLAPLAGLSSGPTTVLKAE